MSVNLGKWLTKRVNNSYSFFNSHSLNSKQVQNFFIQRQFIFLIAMELHFKSGLFSYTIVCFNFVSKDWKNHQTFNIEICFNSDDHDFSHDAVT